MSEHASANSRQSGFRSGSRASTAFTLIEVLVVVAIIALLISILLPSLKAAREEAKKVTCGSNLHQIGISVTHYVNDNKGELPVVYRSASSFTTYYMRFDGVHNGAVNLGLIANRRYMKEPHVFYCPGQDTAKSASLSYDKQPENPWVHESEYAGMTTAEKNAVRLRSSYPARLIEVMSKNTQIGGTQTVNPLPSGSWWESGINGRWRQDKYSQKVIYSDFTGVRDWTGGGVDPGGFISSPHDYKGFNRLFGDTSVRWAHMTAVNSRPMKSLGNDKGRPVNGTPPTPEELVAYFKDVLDRIP